LLLWKRDGKSFMNPLTMNPEPRNSWETPENVNDDASS
jgi:hypothetical protein